MKNSTLFGVLWLLLNVSNASCRLYREGDLVTMLKRSLHQGFSSEFSEVGASKAPHFAIDRFVELVPQEATQIYATEHPFKLSFSFDDTRFPTTWITVTDGRGTFLEAVELEFLYSGGSIRRLRARPHYSDVKGEKPKHIYLHYRWIKEQAVDAASGTVFFLVVSIVLTIYSMISAGFSADRQHSDKMA